MVEEVSIVRESGRLHVYTSDHDFSCKSIIIATGAKAKYLNLPGEERYKNNGLSACAVCDGSLPCYRNKDLIVVGGGDSAAEEALYLSRFAKTVTILVRGKKMRATTVLQDRLKKNDKILILYNSEIYSYLGSQFIEGVIILNNKTGNFIERAVAGVFMAIGHSPSTDFLKNTSIARDAEGYIRTGKTLSNGITEQSTSTTALGIFSAGDCSDKIYRQAITASGFGCMAALK
jgi:thioredoxin reductase (NADPH)